MWDYSHLHLVAATDSVQKSNVYVPGFVDDSSPPL
jgi:hypothetical protein